MAGKKKGDMSNPLSEKRRLSFWGGRLAQKIILRFFVSLLVLQLLLLYPISAYYEKLQLDVLEQEGLMMMRSLFPPSAKTASVESLSKALNELMDHTSLRGITIAHGDGKFYFRLGLKPGYPMNNQPKLDFLLTNLRAEQGQYYDVSWDDKINNLPFDIIARFDASAITPKLHYFILNTLIFIALSSLTISGLLFLILRNSLFKPLSRLKNRLGHIIDNPSQIEKWIITHFSMLELGEIEKQFNELIRRLFDAQKTFKAHEAILELRVEERTKELSQLVNYDVITELPNRKLLKERLNELIEQAKNKDKKVALLVLLLSDFHEINNAFGPAIGHLFLIEVARNLSENAPAGACLAHISTSQFAIAKGDLAGTHHVANLAQWILDMFIKPISINGQNILTTVNLGIYLFPLDGSDAETLMNNANLALQRAKNSAPNTYQFYEANMNKITETRRTMLVDLHYALEQNQFVAYYQPQVDLNTHKIIGVEALLRWIHPEKGFIPPDLFIRLAEESGLIIGIGEWMLREACQQALKWEAEGLPKLIMAVNLSGVQFKQKNIVEMVNRVLIETGFPQVRLELEITESTIIDNIQEAIYTLKALHGLGPSIAIDDFGTGYSSLSYLRRFPIQKLKIDQSFVRDIKTHDKNEKPLADIILLLAQTLNLRAIAEGIETEAQAQYLKERGCQEGQGYLYGKPVPSDQIVELFKKP